MSRTFIAGTRNGADLLASGPKITGLAGEGVFSVALAFDGRAVVLLAFGDVGAFEFVFAAVAFFFAGRPPIAIFAGAGSMLAGGGL